MVKDVDFSDTLMHVSGNIIKSEVAEHVRAYRETAYIRPGELSD
jgi:hypothetical protein